MTILVTKHSPQIILVKVPVLWTWDEAFDAQRQLHGLLPDMPAPTGVLVECPPDTIIPTNAVASGIEILSNFNPKTKAVVLIGGNLTVRALVNVYNRLNHRLPERQIYHADSFADGLGYLQRRLKLDATSHV